MSRYFEALNRLRRGREAGPRPDLRLADDVVVDAAPAAEELSAGPGLPFPELQLASRQAAYAGLLDRLRATIETASIPAVVIAGVSGGEPVREAVAGIELQAQRRGVLLKSGRFDLQAGARVLHLSTRHPLEDPAPGSRNRRESLRLSGSQESDALAEWLKRAAADSDLLLIEAPPISSSVEAALLGGACGGLVLVAEAMVTERTALQEGIERVRLSGCEILGIVLTGTRAWLPRWMGRLINLAGRP